MKVDTSEVVVKIENLNWRNIIIPAQDAVALMSILRRAKVFDNRYGANDVHYIASPALKVHISSDVPCELISEAEFEAKVAECKAAEAAAEANAESV